MSNFDRITNPNLRHDFILIYDVTDGNPNGDPDGDGAPRQDPIDGHGRVSGTSIKRKVRDALKMMFGSELYIDRGATLDEPQQAAMKSAGEGDNKTKAAKTRAALFERYLDIRLFGAVLTQVTKDLKNGGQVTGAIQIDMGKSISPIEIRRDAITRCAGAVEDATQNQGARYATPYALYTSHGCYSPAQAKAQGNPLSSDDLAKFWKALLYHLDLTGSTMRGNMMLHDVLVYTHTNQYGSARYRDIADAVVITTAADYPRQFSEYEVEIGCPDGVTLTRLFDAIAMAETVAA
jgi:CRISPR-associated protein Csd2